MPLSILELQDLGKEHWRELDAPNMWSNNEPHGIAGGPWPRSRQSGHGYLHLFHRGTSPCSFPDRAAFQEVDQGRIEVVTSALTLLEVLAVPSPRRPPLGSPLRIDSHGLWWSAQGRHLARSFPPCCTLRATTGLKMPDSWQLVAA